MKRKLRVFQLAIIIGADPKKLEEYLSKWDTDKSICSKLSIIDNKSFRFFKKIMSDLTNIEEDTLYTVWLLTLHNWDEATDTQIKHAQYLLKDLYSQTEVETDGDIIRIKEK